MRFQSCPGGWLEDGPMANRGTNILGSSRNIWIGLIIAISFGLGLEFLKSARSSVSESAGRTRFFGLVSDDESTAISKTRPEARSESRDRADRARSRLLRGRLGGLDAVTSTPANALVPATAVKKVAPTVLAEVEVKKAADAKKAAADAKKKKKKKKKEAFPEAVASNQSPAATSDDSGAKKSSNDDFGGGSSLYGDTTSVGQNNRAGSANLDETPLGLEEWIEYILREPNFDRTRKLVDAQQKRSIDSEIFHEVVRQMLADSREKMHEFAIYALGASPSLRSFLLLEQANSLQPEGSPLRLQSRSYLRAYAKPEHLRILASVISAGADSRISFEALKLIQIAVLNTRARPAAPGNGAPTNGGPTPSAISSTVSRQFSPLVAVLTRFSQVAPDESLQQEAARTLQQVQTIVGTQPTVAAAFQ